MPSYARFQPIAAGGLAGSLRLDTRLYLHPLATAPSAPPTNHHCIGTIWMENPGSAVAAGGHWQQIADPTLSAVECLLLKAHMLAVASGRGVARDEFIEIRNLHYVATANSAVGWQLAKLVPRTAVPSVASSRYQPRFTWLAWGANAGVRNLIASLAGLTSHFPQPVWLASGPNLRAISAPGSSSMGSWPHAHQKHSTTICHHLVQAPSAAFDPRAGGDFPLHPSPQVLQSQVNPAARQALCSTIAKFL